MAGECIFSNDEISINDNNILNGIEIKYLRETTAAFHRYSFIFICAY